MLDLKLMEPSALGKEEFELLVKCDMVHPEHTRLDVTATVHELWSGELELWKCPEGVILAQPNKPRYTIVRICGADLIFRFKEIAECLQHRARELGCTAFDCMVYNSKVVSALKRIGAEPEATLMVLEF